MDLNGRIDLKNKKIAIIISRYNQLITKKLLEGALEKLEGNQVDTIWVPGAYELPLAAKNVAMLSKYDGIVCLGCVIQGDTQHFDFVCAETARGIMNISLDYNTPISFGVLTTNNLDQALERSGGKVGNKGHEAALATLEMISLKEQITQIDLDDKKILKQQQLHSNEQHLS